jgi:hypothetical protein
MNKIIALALALSFAAPLAASADQLSVAQKVQQTYHTNFPGVGQAEAGAR